MIRDALPELPWSHLQLFLVCWSFCLQFVFNNCKVPLLDLDQMRDLAIKSLVLLLKYFRVIIHLHSKAPSYQFPSVCLNVSGQYSLIHFNILPVAVTQVSPFHWHTYMPVFLTVPPPCLTSDRVLLIISCSFPSPYFSRTRVAFFRRFLPGDHVLTRTGPDNIPGPVLRACVEELTDIFTNMFSIL